MFIEPQNRADTSVSLLAEVDFKWLMAGQGLLIDLARFRGDSIYAAGLIALALDSDSVVLRASASMLLAKPNKQLT